MFLRKAAVVILLVALVLGGITAFFAWKNGSRYFSDPALARQNESYERLFSTNAPPAKPARFFDDISIERTNTQVTIRVPEKQLNVGYKDLQIHRADGTNRIRVDAGFVSLAAIASAYAAPKTNFDYVIEIPGSYYAPDLSPLPPAQLTNLVADWERKLEFRGRFPAGKFVFSYTNLSEVKLLDFEVFDARTRMSLTDGGSSSSSDLSKTFWFAGDIYLWHQTPVEIVVTIATGTTQVFSLPPEENAELDYDGGHLKLIAPLSEGMSGWSIRSDGRTNVAKLNRASAPSAFAPKASFLFAVWPRAAKLPVDFEFLGADGKALPGYSSSTAGQLLNVSIRAELDEVKSIRVKVHPNIHRLVFTIPELPGLPAGNRGVKNLFDVQIPFSRFANEWEVQSTIGHLIGMSMPYIPLNPTNIYYPLIYTNTTARALFRDLDGYLLNPEDSLKADPVANKVEVRPPPWNFLLTKLRRVFSGK